MSPKRHILTHSINGQGGRSFSRETSTDNLNLCQIKRCFKRFYMIPMTYSIFHCRTYFICMHFQHRRSMVTVNFPKYQILPLQIIPACNPPPRICLRWRYLSDYSQFIDVPFEIPLFCPLCYLQLRRPCLHGT